MTYQSRSARIKSLARNDNSIYWSATDTFSNVTDVTRSSSRHSMRPHSRNYIDPWDLENYAYIQRSMESDESNYTPHSPHEDIANPYYVTNNKVDDCPCYAGLDEQLFYNAKYEMIPDPYTDMEEISSNSCGGSTMSTLQYRNNPHLNFPPPPMQSSSAYECYANVVVPKRRTPYDNMAVAPISGFSNAPELMHDSLPVEYPQPEIYYDQYTDQYVPARRQSTSQPCYECIEMQSMPVYYTPSKMRDDYELYDQRRNLDRFGLSKKGLLQIDYSVSWMNLQRLISSK